MNSYKRTVLLVGGGRWGRVHASNLFSLLAPNDEILWVSRHNHVAAVDFVRPFQNGPSFNLLTGLGEALLLRPDAAVIVSAPDSHVAMASACLHHGIPCFVEKPLAFRGAEARTLIEIAANKGLVLAVGLHLLSATYLRHFKSQISIRELSRIEIQWFDPAHEVRHGERKRSDGKIPIVHDLYPHVWSIVRVLTDCDRQIIVSAAKQLQHRLSFHSSAFDVMVAAQCDRRADARARKVDLAFRDGGSASLDFTEEPGYAMLDHVPLARDSSWGKEPRPVMAEVRDFLDQISLQSYDKTWPHLAENCIDSVIGAEALDSLLS
jgi:predicted dehydrogenase